MSTLIDLHLHTKASDGLLSPSELVAFASANGVGAIAITDHDTVAGVGEALERAAQAGIVCIPGIEFSVEHPASFHLLGLFVDHAHPGLVKRTEDLQRFRENRAERMHADLAAHGIFIPYEDVIEEAGGAAIGKPHFARVLVKHGYAGSHDEVFTRFLEKGMPGYASKEKILPEEALTLIDQAGGIAVLAHPVSLQLGTGAEFEIVLRGLVDQGLRGIEVYASMHADDEVRDLLALARKYNLLVSGGSDFHDNEETEMGYYGLSRPIPVEILDPLMRAGG
ncbi:MAG: phosphatase [Spirochaetes bacterium]|nr:MAG: phosphatase [Spirochaetota bacterium]